MEALNCDSYSNDCVKTAEVLVMMKSWTEGHGMISDFWHWEGRMFDAPLLESPAFILAGRPIFMSFKTWSIPKTVSYSMYSSPLVNMPPTFLPEVEFAHIYPLDRSAPLKGPDVLFRNLMWVPVVGYCVVCNIYSSQTCVLCLSY